MIERRKKICSVCGKESYIFSKGRCKSCSQKAYAKTAQNRSETTVKPLSRKSNGKIPLRTKKRSTQENEYKKICDQMDARPGKKICFFCGEEIKGKADHHHLDGRRGDRLIDRKYIVHAHRECHAIYHDQSMKNIPWMMGFINRLSDIDVELAERIMNKYDK
jgi:ribosomal protein L37E